MLVLDHVTKSYAVANQTIAAVSAADLTVGADEFVAVQGPSGCGKSTLLLMAGGLLHPNSGRVTLAGQDLYALAPEHRARFRATHVGFVFQQFHLVPYLSVLDNVLAAALATGLPEARSRALELIERFGLGNRIGHVPGELSVGERQRTALARALLNRPKLLLADEPTGNLDAENAGRVLAALRAFATEGGAVLLVTHDAQMAAGVDRSVRMQQGRVGEVGVIGAAS